MNFFPFLDIWKKIDFSKSCKLLENLRNVHIQKIQREAMRMCSLRPIEP